MDRGIGIKGPEQEDLGRRGETGTEGQRHMDIDRNRGTGTEGRERPTSF